MAAHVQEDSVYQERRLGGGAADSSWSTVGWYGGTVDEAAIAILPHGLDGHQVKDVIAGMGLQRSVLLTPHLHVRAHACMLPASSAGCSVVTVLLLSPPHLHL